MKKTVDILIVEPKNLLLDLTKKAIQSKPDQHYSLNIVNTATTAKAGHFELQKQKPHILLLNPQLPDEDGKSFISQALEHLPQLKIIVMTSEIDKEAEYLKYGAFAVCQVPIQKATVWRRLDQVIEEVDSIGMLSDSNFDFNPEDDNKSQPFEDLFVLEDPNDENTFTPIFSEMMNQPKQSDSLESKSPLAHHKSESSLVMDDELEIFNWDSLEGTQENTNKKENNVFDKTNEDDNTPNSIMSDDHDFVNQTKLLEDDALEDETEANEDLDLFTFDITNSNETSSTIETAKQTDLDFDIVNLPKIPDVQENTTNIDTPSESVKGDEDNDLRKDVVPEVENPDTNEQSTDQESSNVVNDEKTLYLENDEYNKKPTKKGHSFESGFLNKNNDFVPIYPPFETFSKVDQTSARSSSITQDGNLNHIESESEEGIFSSVKNIFKRH